MSDNNDEDEDNDDDNDEASNDDCEQEESESKASDESVDNEPTTNKRAKTANNDDDIFDNERFTPSSKDNTAVAPSKQQQISDDLQEMLAHAMSENFKSASETHLTILVYFLSWFYQ